MRRRQFIALIGGSALTWALRAQAQQAGAQPIVALINGRASDPRLASEFRKGLSQTGRNDGQNVLVEYHWLDGHYERVT